MVTMPVIADTALCVPVVARLAVVAKRNRADRRLRIPAVETTKPVARPQIIHSGAAQATALDHGIGVHWADMPRQAR
jgi:hypothetical protein